MLGGSGEKTVCGCGILVPTLLGCLIMVSLYKP